MTTIETEVLLDQMNEDRDEAAERIYGLLSGTNEGDDNVIQILEDFGLRVYNMAGILIDHESP